MRKTRFQNDYYYHIFNRGVDKRNIFMDENDFIRFIRSMREFNQIQPIGSLYFKNFKQGVGVKHPIGCLTPCLPCQPSPPKLIPKSIPRPILTQKLISKKSKLVEFICYCLNPNHYHFLIKQLTNGGIPEFMKRLSGGYTNYFNKKYKRSGSLFQGTYKAIPVKKYSHFLKLAVYINCNSEVHGIHPAGKWPWSSYLDYTDRRQGTLCNKNIISQELKTPTEFKNFCDRVLPNLKEIKKYLLE